MACGEVAQYAEGIVSELLAGACEQCPGTVDFVTINREMLQSVNRSRWISR